MKTQHLRKDKTCLNCGTEVPDRFCSHCGQENVETKESFGHLVSHFFQDITHYDSKFITTLKYLFFYPGLLTKEYISGKRISYVNPIRLYVFTSFVFFLILSTVGKRENPYERDVQVKQKMEFQDLVKQSARLRDSLRRGEVAAKDTISVRNAADILQLIGSDSVQNAARKYDSLQQSLPPHLREDWWERKVTMRTLEMRDKYGVNMQNAIDDKIAHSYPQLMFLLLPFFALLLKLFFPRRSWVYADHAIFSIHMHTFIFMLGILAMLIVNWLLHKTSLYVWMMVPVYLYFLFAMRNAYQVSFGTAFLKSLGILTLYALGAAIVGIIFVLFIFVIA